MVLLDDNDGCGRRLLRCGRAPNDDRPWEVKKSCQSRCLPALVLLPCLRRRSRASSIAVAVPQGSAKYRISSGPLRRRRMASFTDTTETRWGSTGHTASAAHSTKRLASRFWLGRVDFAMISAREAGPAESMETMLRAAALSNLSRPAGVADLYWVPGRTLWCQQAT